MVRLEYSISMNNQDIAAQIEKDYSFEQVDD